MTGDVIGFEVRMVQSMRGNEMSGPPRLQSRSLVVVYENGPSRHAEWSQWEDAPLVFEQTLSPAAQQRLTPPASPAPGTP